MDGRTIAIGDIHGCARALAKLLAAIAPCPDDRLVVMGDYIDRGPDSRDVIEQLLALRSRCQMVALLGNHELMLQQCLPPGASLQFWLQYGGRETLASYGGELSGIPASHLDFIADSRRFFETPQHIFVHANYVADVALDEQPDSVLLWTHLSRLLPAPHQSGKTAIVGHTPMADGEILDLGYLVAIDTGCFAGGWLTALEVTTRQIWQANETGELRQRAAEP